MCAGFCCACVSAGWRSRVNGAGGQPFGCGTGAVAYVCRWAVPADEQVTSFGRLEALLLVLVGDFGSRARYVSGDPKGLWVPAGNHHALLWRPPALLLEPILARLVV